MSRESVTEKIKPVILAAKGLVKTYQLSRENIIKALNGVDFEVARGEFMAIMGPSGSGKSTLLNMVGCLDTPTGGQIFIEGEEVSRLSRRRRTDIRRDKIGFIFQQYNLIPMLTAVENVMLPLKYSGVSRRRARQKAADYLERIGLGERLNHRPYELSGGEQQRVSIARSLINEPAIILADEPTGELDTHTSAKIVNLLRSLNESSGQTFILVTHNPEVAAATDRIVKMRDGAIEKNN